MLTKILLAAKRHAFLIASSYTILLIVVSFISLDGIDEIDTDNGDKIFHFLVYFFLVLIWWFTLIEKINWPNSKLIIAVATISIGFGIIIELLQSVLTSYRAADGLDILANTLGVMLASIVIWYSNKNVKKK